MNQDKFLYTSLGIGFFIVALVFFHEDYSTLFANGSTQIEEPASGQEEDTSDQLELPNEPNVPEGSYLIKEGDTVNSIALEFNLDIEDFVNLNPEKIIDTGTKTRGGRPIYIIQPGDVLKITAD